MFERHGGIITWGHGDHGDKFGERRALVFNRNLRYYINVRVFKNTWFARFARKEGISDEELRDIVDQLEAGEADVDYGGDVYKIRVARPGEGKSPQTSFAKVIGLSCFSGVKRRPFLCMVLPSLAGIISTKGS